MLWGQVERRPYLAVFAFVGCKMKFHEDLDFMLRTSTSQETLALLSELTVRPFGASASKKNGMVGLHAFECFKMCF